MLKKSLLCLVIIISSLSLYAQKTKPMQAQKDTLLLQAVKANDIKSIKKMLKADADINATFVGHDKSPTSLWLFATMHANLETIKFLVSKKIDTKPKGFLLDTAKNFYSNSPLLLATGMGKLDVVKYFVEDLKMDINARETDLEGKDGWNALQVACFAGQTEVVRYLLEKGVKVQNEDNFFALIFNQDGSVTPEQEKDLFVLLSHKGLDLTKPYSAIKALFREKYLKKQAYTSEQRLAMLTFLLQKGMDINVILYYDNIPEGLLPRFSAIGEDKIVKFLLEKGADINLQNPIYKDEMFGLYGQDAEKTALMLYVKRNNPEMVKFLLSKGANMKLEGYNGKNAINIAITESENDNIFGDGTNFYDLFTGKQVKIVNLANLTLTSTFKEIKINENIAIVGNEAGYLSVINTKTNKEIARIYSEADKADSYVFVTSDGYYIGSKTGIASFLSFTKENKTFMANEFPIDFVKQYNRSDIILKRIGLAPKK